MMPEALQRLIAGGETLSVEFKGEERSPLNDRDLVEAVACLANRTGTEPAWLLSGFCRSGPSSYPPAQSPGQGRSSATPRRTKRGVV
jgi:hypothetical protein